MGKTTLKHVLKKFLALVEQFEHERKTTENDPYQREFQSLKVCMYVLYIVDQLSAVGSYVHGVPYEWLALSNWTRPCLHRFIVYCGCGSGSNYLSLNQELTESLKCDRKFSCSEGLKDVNRRKNRYKDILPCEFLTSGVLFSRWLNDHALTCEFTDNYTRVVVSEYPGVPGSDYINANYVRGSTGSSCAYIASQGELQVKPAPFIKPYRFRSGPLPNTVVDFWRMIWECEVTLIIMACNERESGKYKCEVYWPQSADEEHQYGNIKGRLRPELLALALTTVVDACSQTREVASSVSRLPCPHASHPARLVRANRLPVPLHDLARPRSASSRAAHSRVGASDARRTSNRSAANLSSL